MKILGYDWEEIQAKQQKVYTSPKIDMSLPAKREITDADRELFAKYGSIEALEAAGFYGIADLFKD